MRVEPLDVRSSRAQWARLANACGSVFSTWEWADVWWRHFGTKRALAVLGCRRGDELVGILPVSIERHGPLRVARLVGIGPGEHLQPLCAPGDRPDVAHAWREAIGDALACDLMLGERMPAGWGDLLGGTLLHRESSPVLLTDAKSWEDYLAAKSSNFREQLRAKERRIARAHQLSYRLADRESLDGDLETLFALHDARWGARGSQTLSRHWTGFHREFAAAALASGWLRLWTMELDGQAVASWYGFRFGGAEWYYQSGRDPRLERASVGLVLLAHTIREAISDGVGTYHLLRGDESYKRRFATHDEGLVTVAVPANARGAAIVGAAAIAVRLPQTVSRRFRSLAGI